MTVTAQEIEQAYRNDMSLRVLTYEEWCIYLEYATRLAVISERWVHDLLTSVHIIDTRVQLLQQMLRDGHDIHGVNMFSLLAAYNAQLQWTHAQPTQPPPLETQGAVSAFEVSFMRETLRPDHFEQFMAANLRCGSILRADPKIFVPGITGFGVR